MDGLSGLNFIQALGVRDFLSNLFPEAGCLAIQSIFFGVVVLAVLRYYNHNKDTWRVLSFVTLQLSLSFITLVLSWTGFTGRLRNAYDIMQATINIPASMGNPDPYSTSLDLNRYPLRKPALVLAVINIFLTQLFLAHYVYRSNNMRPGIISVVFILLFATTGFILSVFAQTGVETPESANFEIFHIIQGVFIGIADFIISFYLLAHIRSVKRGYVENRGGTTLSRISRSIGGSAQVVVNRCVLLVCAQIVLFGIATMDSAQWLPLNGALANVYVFTTISILSSHSYVHGSTSALNEESSKA